MNVTSGSPARVVNPWAALSALCLGFFMILLDTTIVSIAIPAMVRGLNTELNSVVWVISVYLLTYAVPMLFTSRLGDRYGPKRVFVIGLVVFTGASLWCGLSGRADLLIVARAVQGLGAALMTPQTLAFITHLFPPSKRGPAMGAWGGVAGLATVAGPLLGGVLVDRLGWEWIFFVNVPVGALALVMTLFLVPDWQPRHAHRFDVPGILLSGLGLLLIVFGVQNGEQYDWGKVAGSVTIPEIIAAGVVLLAVFVIWQWRQGVKRAEPLVPLRVFGDRNFSTGSLASVAIGFAMTGMFLPLVIYIQSVLGLSPTMAGVLTAPMSLMGGVLAPFVGRLSDRVNAKYLVMLGFFGLALGLAIIGLQARPDTDPWQLVPGLLVCGVGIGCVFSPMSNVTMSSVRPELRGTASGIFNTARQVGGVLGSAAIGVLLQTRIGTSVTHEASVAAAQLPPQYRQAFFDGLAGAASSTSEFGGSGTALPTGAPEQARELAVQVIHNGLTDAAKVTLALPIAVLLLGIGAAAAMRGTKRRRVPAVAPVAEARPAEPAPSRIHGRVSAVTGNPVRGTVLTLINDAGRQVSRAHADDHGDYQVAPPEPGGYILIASAPGFEPVAITVTFQGEPEIKNIELAGGAVLSGHVHAGQGQPVGGAAVVLVGSTGEVACSVLSGGDGWFALTGFSAGSYTLTVAAQGYQPLAHALTLTQESQTRDVALIPATALAGRIWSADLDRPVAGARVHVLDAYGRTVATTVADDEGRYSFTGLPTGDCTVIATGHAPTVARFAVSGGENSHDLELRFPAELPVKEHTPK